MNERGIAIPSVKTVMVAKIVMDKETQLNIGRSFSIKRERISAQCVCCGGDRLSSSPAVLMPFVAHRTFGWKPVVIDESWELSTIKNGNAYSVCNSLCCSDCGLLFLDIRFSDSELARLYDDYRGPDYTHVRELYEPGYTIRNEQLKSGIGYIKDIEDFLEPYLRFPISILDWGGDTGKNTPFKKRNERLHIFDISNKEVISGAKIVSKGEALANQYTLVVCSNVLEHVPYPSDLLCDIINSMDVSTILYLEVPLEDIVSAGQHNLHLKKKHWHEHVNFFTEKSLRCLAENVGLLVIDLKKIRVTTGGKSSFLIQLACQLKSP